MSLWSGTTTTPQGGNRAKTADDAPVTATFPTQDTPKPQNRPVYVSQSVLDALADAETLRLIADEMDPAGIGPGGALVMAAWQGERAGTLPYPLETPDQAAACGRIAAELAFCAVPALREAR